MKKWDIFICLTVLALGAFLIFFLHDSAVGTEIEIYSDGELYATYSLSEEQIVEISTEFGQNTICIRNGKASVVSSDCKDKLEIKAGEISKCGERLICLPNRLVITVVGEGDVDSVSY